jgi:integrase
MENKIQKENNNLALQNYETLKGKLSKVLENQRISKKKQDQILETTQKGFIGLALRNEELLKSNDQLKQQLDEVLKELNAIKQEREEKAARKEARANRKWLPKRDLMTVEIYRELMKAAEGPTYINLRTRMALCILAVTGIRINELLPLKVSQLETLFKENWIAMDRSKRGHSNHKAFLTKEGKKIIHDRQKDFQLIFLMKEPDCYFFTAETNHYKSLDRVVITLDVNNVMREVSNQLPDKPNITSHSFRIGYITQLWKDSKDIEFIKQTIGHRKLDTTSAYVNKLSDQERQKPLKPTHAKLVVLIEGKICSEAFLI